MALPPLTIGSIVIDCDHFEAVSTFWQAALGYEPLRPAADGWVILRDPTGRGPNVSVNLSSEGPLEPYRLHLDLYAEDAAKEVVRLVGLGARVVTPARPDTDFTVLADPDGHLFCVVQH